MAFITSDLPPKTPQSLSNSEEGPSIEPSSPWPGLLEAVRVSKNKGSLRKFSLNEPKET